MSQSHAARSRAQIHVIERKDSRPYRIAERSRVMLDRSITPAARLLYFFLDDLFDPLRGECSWRWQKLALLTGLSRRTFFRLVEELESAGILSRGDGKYPGYVTSSHLFSVPKLTLDSAKSGTIGRPYLITDLGTNIQDPPNPPQAGVTPQSPRRGKQYLCSRCRDRGTRRGNECECVRRRAMEAQETAERDIPPAERALRDAEMARQLEEFQREDAAPRPKPTAALPTHDCRRCRDTGRVISASLPAQRKICTCEAGNRLGGGM